MFWFSKPPTCHKSGEELDKDTATRYPLVPFDSTKPNEQANDLTANGTVYSFSKKSFQEVSVLDFSKTYDVVEPTTASTKTDITFVMVHGGGGCRAMFRPHAELLAAKGHRCVLLDLPGHGTLVETPLTMDKCVETVQSVLDKEVSGGKTIYVGGSLGAYLGFYILDKIQNNSDDSATTKFQGAVLMDCGQNVGPDCSFKARMGLWVMGIMSRRMSNKGLMEAMLSVSMKSPADWKLVESTFGAGMFFDQAQAQVDCLHGVAPADHIPNLGNLPCIFFNGSMDYRDSEDKWLSLCKDQTNSYLHVYEGGDHFFSHDSRFVDDLIQRLDEFGKLVKGL